jgi:hypothetical protein
MTAIHVSYAHKFTINWPYSYPLHCLKPVISALKMIGS